MDENRKKLYDQLSANYDMGTFDEFDSDLDNEDNQKVAWEAMGGQDGYGDFGLFQQAIARSPQAAETETTETTGNTGSAGDTGNTGSAVAPTEATAATMMDTQQPDWTTTGIAMPGEEDADADISLPDAPNPNTPKDQSAGDREIVNEPDVVNDKEQSGNVALHTEDYSTKSVEELYAGLGLENKEYSDEELQNELRRSAERIGWISDPVVFEQRKAEFNNSLNELQRRMLVQRSAAQVEQMKPPLAHQEVMPGLDATTAQEIADARNKRFDYLLHGESGKQGSPYTRAVSTQSGWVRSNQLIEQARHKDKSELDEITDKALNAMSSDPSQRFGSDEEAAIQLAAAMAEEQAQANGGHAKTPSERELEAYYAGPEDTYVEVDGWHDPHEEQLVRQKDAAFRAEVKRHQEGYTNGLRGYATDIEKNPLASADCPVYAIPRMVKGSVENELREKAKGRSFKGYQPGLSQMLAFSDDLEANEYDRHLKNAIRIFGPERYEGYVLAWAKKYYTTIATARVAVDNMIRNEIINQLGLKPSNNWEYLFGSVLNNTFVTQGLKALYGLEKGTRPDDFNYITAQQVAYRQYEDEHNNDWQDKLTQMTVPALTLVADAVIGGFFLAGKAAQLTSLLPRLFYASGEAASRSLMNSAIYRIFMGSLSGAANFATYEMQSIALQQLATGEYRKKHNFWSSLGHAGVSGAAKGMVFGTVGEAFGSLFSGVSGKMVYGVEAGKLLAETATFSAMGYLENGNLTFKDVGTNFGLALSGRASHAGKLIKDIRSRANNDGIYGRKANYHKISEAEKDALVALGYGDVASALRGENISEQMLRRMQNQLEQMRLDKRVSWETIRCCDWVLNGRLNAVPGVRDKIIEADGKGGYTITAVDANGRAIMGSVHVTGTEARNKVLSSINHEIDKAGWVENESKMQSSLIGRQLVETVREYAESTGEDAEALLKTYMTALGKDFDHKSLEPVEKKVYETINELRSGKGQPTDIADTKETIGKRFGVDIDQAIKTEKSQRTKEQRAALAEYQEWLDGREDIIDLHQYRGPAIERPYYGPERGSFERKRELGDDEYTTEVEKWRGGVMLGKVVVVNSLDEVTDAKVRKQIEDGDAAGNKSVPGWYDSKTDTAYIYAPHIIDGKDFNETMLHEVVSHKGLRGLLGEADYNKLLDKIWEDMSPSERKALEDYPGGEENESEVERTRRLADEWLAHRAQGVDVDGRNSIWQTAKRHVKDWLRRHGIDVYYSDYELENKLRESYRELAGKGRKTKAERGGEGEPRKEGPIIEGEPEHIHEDKPDDGAVPPDDGGTTPPEGVAAPPAAESEPPVAESEPQVERPTSAVGRVKGTPADMNDWAELLAENDAASLPVEEVQAGLELMEREREQAHRYAAGELAEEPSDWEYWAARDGLSEPTRQAEPAATEPPAEVPPADEVPGKEKPQIPERPTPSEADPKDMGDEEIAAEIETLRGYLNNANTPYDTELVDRRQALYNEQDRREEERNKPVKPVAKVTAGNPMPMHEVDGKQRADFSATTPQKGHEYIYNELGISKEQADEIVASNIADAEARLAEIDGRKPQKNPGEAVEDYVERLNEWQAEKDAAQREFDYWNQVKAHEDTQAATPPAAEPQVEEVAPRTDGKLPKGARADAETLDPATLPSDERLEKWTDAWGNVTRVEVVGENGDGTTRVRLWFKDRPTARGVEADVDLRGPQPPETPTPPTEPTGDATTADVVTDVTTERPAEVTGSADDQQMRDKLGELLGGDADHIADAQAAEEAERVPARVDEPEEVSADDLEHYADDASEVDGDAVEPFPMKNKGGGRLSPDWERASVEQIVARLMDKSVTENPYQEIEERIASATEKVKQIESEKPKGRVTNAKKEKELHDWQRRRDKAQSQLDKLRSAQTRYRHADMERNRQQAEAAKAEQQRTKRAIDNLVQHIDELDLRDWVAYQIASGSGKFKWKDKEYANGFGGGRTHGLGGHVGGDASAYDMYKRNGYIDEKNGEYPEEFAEHLWSDMPDGMRERYSSRDVLEAVLDVMKSGESRRSLLESLAKDYEQTAEEEFEREQAERDAAEEAEWLDNRRTQGLLDRREADLASRAGAPELADDARADLLADAQARLNDPNASEYEKQAARTVLRYRQRDGRDGVTAQETEGDGVRLRHRAPNGEESNLDERQYDEVRTGNFKKWFGDWENDPEEASKVVDANGEPLVVYHQTNRKQYINRETGQNWDDLDWREREEWNRRSDEEWNDAWEEQDFYTFDNRHARQSVEYPGFFFSPRYDEYHEYGDRTIAAYLDMKNPAIDPDIPNAGVTDTAGRDAMESLMRQGYDGVIRTEDGVPYEYIVFRPEQIKSATENNGDFSSESGDIRLRLRDGEKAEGVTLFSGGGLIEAGLRGIVEPRAAVEYDRRIAGVYRDNYGNHIVTADVRDVDPMELAEKVNGPVQYFHASPVCKNFSPLKQGGEKPLDIETAQSTANAIDKMRPRIVTIENVARYENSEAMKAITDKLDELGYKYDIHVVDAADYGAATHRRRLILRAVDAEHELPEFPQPTGERTGWYERVEDLVDSLPESTMPEWMSARLANDGIDWRNVDRPLIVMSSGASYGKVPHAWAEDAAPTIVAGRTGDRIVLPGGKVLSVNSRVLARLMGLDDNYTLPESESLAHTVLGNGVPVELTKNVIGPLVKEVADAPGESGVRFRTRDDEKRPTFYSNAERAVENVKQGKATAEQWKAMLTKAGGIKAGEDKWMGLTDWLDEHKGQSLTKDEVLQFVRDNGIQMEEVDYGGDEQDRWRRIWDNLSWSELYDTAVRRIEERGGDSEEWDNINDEIQDILTERYGEQVFDHIDYDSEGNIELKGNEIHSIREDYTTPGLENKREIAFVVPGIEPYQQHDEIHFGPENGGRAVMWVRFGETTDTDGKRVLVIDEVQSNRHQDAREKGYRDITPAEVRDAYQKWEEFKKRMKKEYGEGVIGNYDIWPEIPESVKDEIRKAKAEYESVVDRGRGVPAAPFEKNWHEVAMKRMLRLAADEGFDKVAWTTGEQQAERYDLGDAVKSIKATDSFPSGFKEIDIELNNDTGSTSSIRVAKNNGEIVRTGSTFTSDWKGKNLRDVVGKELAERLLADGQVNIRGEALRIGGEGMKGFYDEMLPRFMNKYGKKWGAKVGEVELSTPGREVMHSVDVTPEMKESVEQGQPLFRFRDENKTGDHVGVRKTENGKVRVDGLPGEWDDIDRAAHAMQTADPEHMYVPSENGKYLEVHDWRDNEVWDIWRGKPGSKRYEKWRERTLNHIHKQVPEYAKKLGLDVELIDNEADVPAGHEREKSWYDTETGKVHIVVPRHAAFDVSDVMSSLWHEGVSRHGLRKLVGGDNYDTFLDNVYATSDANIRTEIDRLAEEVTDGDRRGATEEYLSRLAEQMGFQYYKDGSVPVRGWMQRGLKVMRDNFDKLCRHLGMADVTETLRDDDLRAVLYDSYNHLLAENRDAYAVAKRAEREDKEYVKAVKRGDIDTAMTMLHRKLAASEGIVGYAAAHGHGGSHREVSHRLKDSESGAIEQAARDMEQYVPKDAVLVPMPPHEGVVRTDTDTWLLAQELSHLTGAPVVAALRGRERESRYAAKQAGRKGLSADELGFYQDMELPDGKTPVFVDNVVGSGETAKAAVQAMGGKGMTLAYTKGNLGKPTEGLKNVTVTYDDAGNLIPLSERFDRSNSDVRFRVRDGRHGSAGIEGPYGERSEHEAAVEDARRRLESDDASEFERTAARTVIKAYGGGSDDTPDGGVRFRTRDDAGMLVDMAKHNNEVAKQRRDAVTDFVKAITDVDELTDSKFATALGKVMRGQRQYDQETVADITTMVKAMMDAGLLTELDNFSVKQILTKVKDSTGKNDITAEANKLIDIMLKHQLKKGKSEFEKSLKVKGMKQDSRGVVVQGGLDYHGQRMVKALKEGLSLGDLDAVNQRIDEAEQRLSDPNEVVRGNAKDELDGLYVARQYFDQIKQNEIAEAAVKQQLEQAKQDHKNGTMSDEAYKQFRQACEEALRSLRCERVDAWSRLNETIGDRQGESAERAKQFREQQKQRKEEIQHWANSDMEGHSADPHENETKEKGFMGKVGDTLHSLEQWLVQPLGTFDMLMRYFGNAHPKGEGYLFGFVRRFMNQRDQWFKQRKADFDKMDQAAMTAAAAHGVKIKDWAGIYSFIKKLPKLTITVKGKDYQITQGNAVYLLAMENQADGRMKLRAMGLTEADMERLRGQVNPMLLELSDWVVKELLPGMRPRLNQTHIRMFGADMTDIPNYFPIRTSKLARNETVNLAQQGGKIRPATITGSVIERKRNNTDLDLSADFFQVTAEHIDEMEHWNSFAEYARDLNTLLSYNRFRAQVNNLHSWRYGDGKEIWKTLEDTAAITTGDYQPKTSTADTTVNTAIQGLAAANITFRPYTALKQLLSFPVYFVQARWDDMGYALANLKGTWQWAIDNLPTFAERWQGRMAGDPILTQAEQERGSQNRRLRWLGKAGFAANAAVDAMTVAIGARSIYRTKLRRYKEMGYSEEEANKKALEDAAISVNETQQSGLGAFTSVIQQDRTFFSRMVTLYRNASMGYQRQLAQGLKAMRNSMSKEWRDTARAKVQKKLERDGIDSATAAKVADRLVNRESLRGLALAAMFGSIAPFVWSLGAQYLGYKMAGGDDDEQENQMLAQAATHLLSGWAEGIVGGSTVSSAADFIYDYINGRKKLRDYSLQHDLLTDMSEQILGKSSSKPADAVYDIVNMLVAMGTGVNPKSIVEPVVGILDVVENWGGDAALAHEVALGFCRVLNVPQTSLDKVYVDEIGLTAREAQNLSAEEFAERWCRYKRRRGAGYLSPLTSEESDKELEKKLLQRYERMMDERFESLSDERVEKIMSSTDDKLLKKHAAKAYKSRIDALTDDDVQSYLVPLSDNAPQDSVDVKREGIKRAYKSEGLSYRKPNDDAKNALAYERHATYDDIAEDTALKGRKDALKKSVGETFEKMGVKYKKGSAGWDWYAEDDASASIDEIKAYYQSHKAELDEYGILLWWFDDSKGSSGYIKKGFTDGKHDPDEVMKEYRETRKEVLAKTKQR